MGRWEGHLYADLAAAEPEAFAGKSILQLCLGSPGETPEALQTRIEAFLGDLSGPAVIVSHGVALTILRAQVLNATADEMEAMSRDQGVVWEIRDGSEHTHR
jgi:probable phosphoglycerate mutase